MTTLFDSPLLNFIPCPNCGFHIWHTLKSCPKCNFKIKPKLGGRK